MNEHVTHHLYHVYTNLILHHLIQYANLQEDYTKIREWALQNKQMVTVSEWIEEKADNTYVKINEEYQSCEFVHDWGMN